MPPKFQTIRDGTPSDSEEEIESEDSREMNGAYNNTQMCEITEELDSHRLDSHRPQEKENFRTIEDTVPKTDYTSVNFSLIRKSHETIDDEIQIEDQQKEMYGTFGNIIKTPKRDGSQQKFQKNYQKY